MTTQPSIANETIGALFREGRIADAIKAANDAVRRAPAAADPRVLLAELLLFDGNLQRADNVLDAAAGLDPSASLVVAEFRQLLRAAMARRQVLLEGRAPDFVGQPTASQTHLLQALVALRAGDVVAAAGAAEAAELSRPAIAGRLAVPGERPDVAFMDFRDADDLWAGSFEILTSTGKYFWIPTERVVSLEFHAPVRPRDLLWRRCSMTVRDGPDGDVYMPAVYAENGSGSDQPLRSTLRLGRETEWTQDMPVRGLGQRVFLVGDEGLAIHEATLMEFA